MSDSRRDRLRRAVRQRVREIDALLALSLQFDARRREKSERLLDELRRMTAKETEHLLLRLTREQQQLVILLRPASPPADLAESLEEARPRPNTFLWIPRWHLRELLPGLESAVPSIKNLPQHARITVDVLGVESNGRPPEIRILEAGLFEDMCAHVNAAQDLRETALTPSAPKPLRKALSAFRRSAVLVAFNMVEAYINSVAFDTLVERGDSLALRDRDLLSEWDSTKNRQRLVPFREKLLQYPKIAINVEHPPLQESNCPEYALLLGAAKDFRDAIVHANPKPSIGPLNLDDPVPQKEVLFWQLPDSDDFRYINNDQSKSGHWLEIVDAAIGAVKRIHATIHPERKGLFWVHDRATDGRFPEKAFD